MLTKNEISKNDHLMRPVSWWRHEMETFSASLALCAGNSPVTDEYPAQGPVTRSFDVVFDVRLNKRLGNQSWGWWSETPTRSLWRHCNVLFRNCIHIHQHQLEAVSSRDIYSVGHLRNMCHNTMGTMYCGTVCSWAWDTRAMKITSHQELF